MKSFGEFISEAKLNRIDKFEIAPKSTEKQLSWYDAVEYCKNLVVDGKSDWRLPSKDELDQMYKNKNSMPSGEKFASKWYWSSSERAATLAWFQFFSDSSQYATNKTTKQYVRAVRSI